MVCSEGGVLGHLDPEVVEPGALHQDPDPLRVHQAAVAGRQVPLVDPRQVRTQQNWTEGE